MYRKKITLKDIAAAVGVSPTTVSLILNGRRDVRIGEETRELVLAAAAELGYSFTLPKKADRKPLVCFVHGGIGHLNISTSFFGRVAGELRRLCAASGIGMLEFDFSREEGIDHYQALVSYRPLAFVSYGEAFPRIHLNQRNEIPLFILQGEGPPIGIRGRSHILNVDDLNAGRLAALHLLEKGYRSCAVVFPEISGRCIQYRHDGFIEVFSGQGGRTEHISFSPSDHDALESWFFTGDIASFDSFFFFSDAMAIPGIRGLTRRGLSLPEDAGVIATDNLYWGRYTVPALTTMELHEAVFAERIREMLEGLLQEKPFFPGETVIPVSLIERESTARDPEGTEGGPDLRSGPKRRAGRTM